MGRYASTPEVEDTGTEFVIVRTLFPDDEFAAKQVLGYVYGSNDLEWQDNADAWNALSFTRHPLAQACLSAYLYGIEEGIDEARRRLY